MAYITALPIINHYPLPSWPKNADFPLANAANRRRRDEPPKHPLNRNPHNLRQRNEPRLLPRRRLQPHLLLPLSRLSKILSQQKSKTGRVSPLCHHPSRRRYPRRSTSHMQKGRVLDLAESLTYLIKRRWCLTWL